jgi:hypothetical protein
MIGYGIVRPKLLRPEWIALSIVSILYFAAGMYSVHKYYLLTVLTDMSNTTFITATSYEVSYIIQQDLHHSTDPKYVNMPSTYITINYSIHILLTYYYI